MGIRKLNRGIFVSGIDIQTNIPRYIVWSMDNLQLNDPFQRRWLLKQTLTHGRAEDIRKLDLKEIALELDSLNLLEEIYSLWKRYLEYRNGRR